MTREINGWCVPWKVGPTGNDDLPPVRVIARSGPFHVQDYFTVEDAREFAAALITAADAVDPPDEGPTCDYCHELVEVGEDGHVTHANGWCGCENNGSHAALDGRHWVEAR